MSTTLTEQPQPRTRRSALPAVRTLTVIALGLFVLPPLGVLLTGAFTSSAPGVQSSEFDLTSFVTVMTDTRTLDILLVTLKIALGTCLASAVLGFLFAWLTTRTDMRFRRTLSLGILLPFFIPGSVSAVAWAGLANPTNGTITGFLRPLGIDLNVYGIAGIIFVETMYAMPLVFIGVVSALENMDSRLEEAAFLHGASRARTLSRIILPLAWPSLLGMTTLLFLRMLAAFEVPYILGTPARIEVFSSTIYNAIYHTAPPRYDVAAAMSVLLIGVTFLLLFVLRKQLRAGDSTRATVRGKGMSTNFVPLGRWRGFWAGVLTVYVLVAAVTPLISITLGALSGTGRPNDLTRLSLDPILRVLSSSPAEDAFVTTLQLSLLVGVVTGALALVTTYVARRSSRTFDSFVDTLMTVPVAVPGAVLGLALLWTWLPITYPVDLYGSTTLLVIGYALVALPVAGRLLSASDAQIHPELEEAALVHGAGLFRTFTHVYLPVMASGAVAAFFLSALYVPKEAAVAAMLVTADTTTLPALILAYWRSGDASAVMVMSLLLVLCIVVLWLIQIILRRLIQSRNVRGAK